MEKSTTNTALFVEYLFAHFNAHGGIPAKSAAQTDNGKEFTTWWDSPKQTLFEKVVARHNVECRHIPFGSPTHNSDVEAAHKLIELECNTRMRFPSPEQFLRQSEAYQRYFNLERVNRYKGGSPAQFLRAKHPDIPESILVLKPVVVDTLLTRDKLDDWRKTYGVVY